MTVDSSTGKVSWTPLNGVTDSGDVNITATDNGSPHQSVSKIFKITVTAVNDAPVITSTAPTEAYEEQEFKYTPIVADEENNSISWEISNKPDGMNINASTGEISWTPAQDINTSGEVNITATDNGIPNQSVSQLFKLSVTDKTSPTLTIKDDTSDNDDTLGLKISESERVWVRDIVTFEFLFSEPVTEFDIDDIDVENGTKGDFSGSGDSYKLAVIPTADINEKNTITVTVGI